MSIASCSSETPRLTVILREEDVGDGDEAHGHVTSISVLRSYRRLGLAKRLMIQSRACTLYRFYRSCSLKPTEEAMATVYRASYVSLHVRKSNRAALALYKDTLGFTVQNIEKGYCE